MKVIKPVSIVLVVGVSLLLFILRPFGFTDKDVPIEIGTATENIFSPDAALAELPYGNAVLAARDISRFDGEEALLRIDLLDQRGTFQAHPLYQAYYFMIMNNIMLRLGRIDDAVAYANQLLDYAKENNMQWVKASALSELAIERTKRGELDIALVYLNESVRISKEINYQGLLIKSYNTLGVISNISGDYAKAQTYLHNGLKLVESNPEHLYYSKIIANLALIYIYLEEWHKALEYIEKSKHIYKNGRWLEPSIMTILLSNESHVYFRLGDAVQARRAYSQADETLVKESSLRLQSIVSNELSNVLYLEQQYEAAIAESNRCLNLVGIQALPLQRGNCYTSKARSEIKLENYFTALHDLDDAIAENNKISNSVSLSGNHKLLSEVHEELGNDIEALQFFKLYYIENKKALFDQRQSELYMLEESFNAENSRNTLALLKTQNDLKDLELERQKLGVRVVFGMIFFVLLSLGYVIRKNATIAKKNERLQCSNTDLVELSTRDALTGLYNRRHFDDYIRGLKQDSAFYHNSNFTLAIMDLDHFKMINDSHGHDVGDLVLIEVAKRFMLNLPSSDLIIRWGGEEFICVIENKDNVSSLQMLKKVWSAITDEPVSTPAGDINITLSIGAVTDIPAVEFMARHTELLKRADERLYKAKHTGRNQIIAID
ncbi:GGDEF domain-containing protein [Moritella marina ATCC 15381]|uniref:diguanylate cyclase n=1 Tax=Moritella marina ATCC 15381 TaxID=1202962 RepID=A0A5J6WLG6_MORMI|nr:tetratricopeptide repeat-containing diguanylate cyclase [Moritella marina]QFI37282.1 GGDEF domain-containing protein [Moritella marina ATCC 15381]